MTILYSLTLVLVVLSVAWGSAIVPPEKCTYRGQEYTGEFSPSPCEKCQCVMGKAMCIVIDCFPVICVDSVREEMECCARCPNGENCAHEGHIINYGDTYNPDPKTVCRCPENQYHFGYNHTDGTVAVCSPRVEQP